MYIVKVLKRRDAASVIVAVVLAMVIVNVLPLLTSELAGTLANAEEVYSYGSGYSGGGWRTAYLAPIISLFLQVVLIEIGLRLAVAMRSVFVRRG